MNHQITQVLDLMYQFTHVLVQLLSLKNNIKFYKILKKFHLLTFSNVPPFLFYKFGLISGSGLSSLYINVFGFSSSKIDFGFGFPSQKGPPKYWRSNNSLCLIF